jgi:hypothetical protein
MKTRPTINAKCNCCGKLSFLRRLRGPWRGLVQDHSHPDLLPQKDDGSYTLKGFRCWRCRGE